MNSSTCHNLIHNQVAILNELENGKLFNKDHLNNWLPTWKNK